MSDVVFREAVIDDAAAIVDLATQGFAAERRALFIYACRGAESYVRAQIASDPRWAERRYFVATDADGQVRAIADLSRVPTALHLANIGVDPAARGRRLAPRLLLHALQALHEGPGDARTVQLDVFADNTVATGWYQRLGLVPVAETGWFRAARLSVASAVRPGCFVRGEPIANLAHEAFGFSELTLQTRAGRWAVGRIGDGWFRLAAPEALDDPDFMPLLTHLDAGRGLLVLSPIDPNLAARGFEHIATAERRCIDLQLIMARLEENP